MFKCCKVPSAQAPQSQKHNRYYNSYLTGKSPNNLLISEFKHFKAKYLYSPDDIILLTGVKVL
jgi:hypothetical protein